MWVLEALHEAHEAATAYVTARDADRQWSALATRWDTAFDSDDEMEPDGMDGDRILESLRHTLDYGFEFQRSFDQKRFHDAYLHAILPKIYGEEWELAQQRVMEKLGIDSLSVEVLCMCPRRWGKTWALAMFVAAVLYCVPRMKIAVFTTGNRAGRAFRDKAVMFLGQLEDGMRRIVKDAGEKLYVAVDPLSPGKKSTSAEAIEAQRDPLTSQLTTYPGGRSADGKCGQRRAGPISPSRMSGRFAGHEAVQEHVRQDGRIAARPLHQLESADIRPGEYFWFDADSKTLVIRPRWHWTLRWTPLLCAGAALVWATFLR